MPGEAQQAEHQTSSSLWNNSHGIINTPTPPQLTKFVQAHHHAVNNLINLRRTLFFLFFPHFLPAVRVSLECTVFKFPALFNNLNIFAHPRCANNEFPLTIIFAFLLAHSKGIGVILIFRAGFGPRTTFPSLARPQA